MNSYSPALDPFCTHQPEPLQSLFTVQSWKRAKRVCFLPQRATGNKTPPPSLALEKFPNQSRLRSWCV